MSCNIGPCMCGATDCPSCGPAQGYEIRKVWTRAGWRWINPEDDDGDDGDDDGMAALEEDGFDLSGSEPDDHAANMAADRYERDIDARRA